MLLSVSFNGILTDINRSRDEWRLTLKYYACRLPSFPISLFWSLTRRELNHLSNQVHFAKNINELITNEYQWWEFNDSDVTFYIEFNEGNAHLSEHVHPDAGDNANKFVKRRKIVSMLKIEIPTACRFRLGGTVAEKNFLNPYIISILIATISSWFLNLLKDKKFWLDGISILYKFDWNENRSRLWAMYCVTETYRKSAFAIKLFHAEIINWE